MRIAVIGAGQVGGAIGGSWAARGHEVTYGVRDPASAKSAALAGRSGAVCATPVAAAQRSDVIAIAVPWTVAESVVAGLGDLSGKIVVDCTNPLAFADGALSLDRGYTTSGAETLAALVPAARVVKSLNQAGFEIMADPSRLTQRPAMFVAGDDEDAKIAVMALVSDLGFEAFDAGALRMARLLEPLAMVWINQAIFRGLGRQWAFGVVRPL